jgi:23S rRNA (guanosine2251-2'-O)-methyltransferase
MAREHIIYGIHPIVEAIRSGQEFEKIFIQSGLKGEAVPMLNKLIRENQIPCQQVPVQKLDKLVRGNHQGIVAFISRINYQSLTQLIPMLYEQGRTPFLLILDRVTDVRNFGAIARSAECAGVDAIIIPDKGSAQINEDAIKTSSGALLQINVCREHNLKDVIFFLRESGVKVVSVTEKSDTVYYDEDFTLPVALILGSEEDGISPAYLKISDSKLKIPLEGTIESLNVSVAAGVLLYEVIRQRRIH